MIIHNATPFHGDMPGFFACCACALPADDFNIWLPFDSIQRSYKLSTAVSVPQRRSDRGRQSYFGKPLVNSGKGEYRYG
jgi:hypothetical protein